MKPARLGATRFLMVAIVPAIAALAYADGHAAPGGGGESRALGAAELQAAIARTQLVGKMETRLGAAYGGAWFEPAAGRLHVGATSPAAAREAESVAAEVSLAASVTATPVASSWPELLAAQQRWNRRLAELFAARQVSTWVSARESSVGIELASSVPGSTVESLRREADAADHGVLIRTAPVPALRGQRDARCAEFAPEKGTCDSPIVAGQTIVSKTKQCTAGPTTILQDRSTPLAATKTYLLTAGHCIQNGGGLKEVWSAYDKKGNKLAIGPAVEFINAKTDVGIIEVETPGKWADSSFVPVLPTYVEWDEEEEAEPLPVLGVSTPIEGFKSCVSGQKSGFSCGKIVKVKVTYEGTEELVEVSGAITAEGDSGAPWYPVEGATIGYVEGTHVMRNSANNNPLFQPLEDSFTKLTTKLEILKEGNKERHAFKFVSEGTPTVLTGRRTGKTGQDVITTDGATVSCKEVTYTGEQIGTESTEIKLDPKYTECTSGGGPATIEPNGCWFLFSPATVTLGNNEGTMDIHCPPDKQIVIKTVLCNIKIGPQFNKKNITYTNVGTGTGREITVDYNLSGLAYEEEKNATCTTCTEPGVLKKNGAYTGSFLLKGETKAGAQLGYYVKTIP